MRVSQLNRLLLDRFPMADAEAWDHIGLSVGDPDDEVVSVSIALDASKANIEAAARAGSNVLVTHHPVYIKAPDAFVPHAGSHPSSSAAVYTAARLGVSVISMHTNLDRSFEARNLMAELLRLQSISSLEFALDPNRSGLGLIAECEPIALNQLVERTAHAFSSSPRVWGAPCAPVSRVAVLGGALGDFGELALSSGAQAIVTGEAGYHVCQDLLDRGCNVVLLGHDRSEEPFVDILANTVENAGVPAAHIVRMKHPNQWWTYTKGERS